MPSTHREALGAAFGQLVHAASVELYAGIGMASFIAAGYQTPLAAVVFVHGRTCALDPRFGWSGRRIRPLNVA
jgi:H+/Cl- antiporter ClcA